MNINTKFFIYLVDQHFQFSNTISKLSHTVPYRNRIVQEENILPKLDIDIYLDHKLPFYIHIQLMQVNHFQFLLLDHFVLIIDVYYLSIDVIIHINRRIILIKAYENKPFYHELSST